MPSVNGMTPSVLRQLARDTLFIVLGFPLGLLAVVLSMTGFWLGVGLSVIWIGVPLLMAVMLMARGFAIVERIRIAPVIGRRMPHPSYKRPAGPGVWRRMLIPLTDAQSWR